MIGLSWFHLAATGSNACGTKTGVLPSIYNGLTCTSDGSITINSVSDVLKIIANITQILIALSGGLAVVLLLVASIYYITSTGDPGRTKRARDIIQYTVTGLIIIVIAYAIVAFIAQGI